MKYDGTRTTPEQLRGIFTSYFQVVNNPDMVALDYTTRVAAIPTLKGPGRLVATNDLMYLYVVYEEFKKSFTKTIFGSKNTEALYIDKRMLINHLFKMPANELTMLHAIKQHISHTLRDPDRVNSVIKTIVTEEKRNAI